MAEHIVGVFVWEVTNGQRTVAKICIEMWLLPAGSDGAIFRKDRIVFSKMLNEVEYAMRLDDLAWKYPCPQSPEGTTSWKLILPNTC